MTTEQSLVLGIGVATLALFLWGRWRHDMVALTSLLACVTIQLPARGGPIASISLHSYGEQPLDPACTGDGVRDRYEIELVNAFIDARKPVFGICRGLQVLNVAFGGTLYQDIPTQRPDAIAHVRADH